MRLLACILAALLLAPAASAFIAYNMAGAGHSLDASNITSGTLANARYNLTFFDLRYLLAQGESRDVATSGNLSGQYVFGDGSFLSGINATAYVYNVTNNFTTVYNITNDYNVTNNFTVAFNESFYDLRYLMQNSSLNASLLFGGFDMSLLNETWVNLTVDRRVPAQPSIDGANVTSGFIDPARLNLSLTGLNGSFFMAEGEYRSINTSGNLTVSSGGYLFGQPLQGMMGSGLISVGQGTGGDTNDINVSCSGLACYHGNFTVRLAGQSTDEESVYCFVPEGSVTVSDNAFSAYYVDRSCNLLQTTYVEWFRTEISNGNVWDGFYVLAQDGSVRVIDSVSLERRRMMKNRQITYELHQNHVSSGIDLQLNGWDNFNVTAGQTIMGMDSVDFEMKMVPSPDSVYVMSHNSTFWKTWAQNRLNFTHCDSGTASVACTGGDYRRYLVYALGYDGPITPASRLVQVLPYQTPDYSLAECLDTTANPLSYVVPSYFYGAVAPLYALCAKRDVNKWADVEVLDLRSVSSGMTTGGGDVSGLVPYVGATANVVTNYNVTALSLLPTANDTGSVGSSSLRWREIWSTYAIVNDTFYAGDSGYLIRSVEKPEGLAKQFVPWNMTGDCEATEDVAGCWANVSESRWNETKSVVFAYDGGIIYSGELLTNSKGWKSQNGKSASKVLDSVKVKADGQIDHSGLDSSLVTDGHISIDKRIGLLEELVRQMAATLCKDKHTEYCL